MDNQIGAILPGSWTGQENTRLLSGIKGTARYRSFGGTETEETKKNRPPGPVFI